MDSILRVSSNKRDSVIPVCPWCRLWASPSCVGHPGKQLPFCGVAGYLLTCWGLHLLPKNWAFRAALRGFGQVGAGLRRSLWDMELGTWSHSGVPQPWHRCGCASRGVTALSSEPEQPQPLRKSLSCSGCAAARAPPVPGCSLGRERCALACHTSVSRGISLVIGAAKLVTVGAQSW